MAFFIVNTPGPILHYTMKSRLIIIFLSKISDIIGEFVNIEYNDSRSYLKLCLKKYYRPMAGKH